MAKIELEELIRENQKEIMSALGSHDNRITRNEERISNTEEALKEFKVTIKEYTDEIKCSIEKLENADEKELDTLSAAVAALKTSHDKAIGVMTFIGLVGGVILTVLVILYTLKTRAIANEIVESSPRFDLLDVKIDSLSKRIDLVERLVTPE